MTDLTILPATPDMVPDLAALIEECIRVSNAPDYDAATLELVCQVFSAERLSEDMARHEVFVMRRLSRLLGTVSLGGDELHALFVLPRVQGRGLGRQLACFIEARARDQGVSLLKVSSSITARDFYARLGYRQLRFDQNDKIPTYRMHKDLRPNLDIREMSVTDLAASFVLRAATRENAMAREEIARDYGITEESLAKDMAAGKVRGWCAANADGQLFAYSMGDRTSGEVLVVAVHRDWEGQGLGTAVLQQVVDWLVADGRDEIWLYANADPQLRAHGFYRSLGWRPNGTRNEDEEVLVLKPHHKDHNR